MKIILIIAACLLSLPAYADSYSGKFFYPIADPHSGRFFYSIRNTKITCPGYNNPAEATVETSASNEDPISLKFTCFPDSKHLPEGATLLNMCLYYDPGQMYILDVSYSIINCNYGVIFISPLDEGDKP